MEGEPHIFYDNITFLVRRNKRENKNQKKLLPCKKAFFSGGEVEV